MMSAVGVVAAAAVAPPIFESSSVAVLLSVSGSENESLSVPLSAVPMNPMTTAISTKAPSAHQGLRTAQRDNPPM